MTKSQTEILNSYIEAPDGGLVLEGLQIGRVKFGKITISTGEGAFSAQDLITAGRLDLLHPINQVLDRVNASLPNTGN